MVAVMNGRPVGPVEDRFNVGMATEITYVSEFEYAEQRPDRIDYAVTRHHMLTGVIYRRWWRDVYDPVAPPRWAEMPSGRPADPSMIEFLAAHELLNPRQKED